MRPTLAALMALAGAMAAGRATAGTLEFSANAAAELRVFPSASQRANENRLSPALAFEAELFYETDAGDDRFQLKPFVRLDADDDNRSLYDIGEAYWLHFGDGWDLLSGINKVFWGVTESVHLVDIVNQTDLPADIDGEDKLGQPMINATLYGDWGTLGLFAMTGFRERVFPDEDAWFSTPVPIRDNKDSYDSSLERWQPDLAVRYSQIFGEIDLGLSHFYGTSREPRLITRAGAGGPYLEPHYDLIHQTGLELQVTRGATLYKLEAISRFGYGDWFGAFVGGFEHTLYKFAGSDADLGLLAEYQYDGRDDETSFKITDNDIFTGARLTLNDVQDTALLAGTVVDVTNGSSFAFIEAERRLGDYWKAEIEARIFMTSDDDDPSTLIKDDDVIQFRIARYF